VLRKLRAAFQRFTIFSLHPLLVRLRLAAISDRATFSACKSAAFHACITPVVDKADFV
jgi:hypothetical protein